MCAFYQLNSIMRCSFLLILGLFCQVSPSYAVASDDKLIESLLLQASRSIDGKTLERSIIPAPHMTLGVSKFDIDSSTVDSEFFTDKCTE